MTFNGKDNKYERQREHNKGLNRPSKGNLSHFLTMNNRAPDGHDNIYPNLKKITQTIT